MIDLFHKAKDNPQLRLKQLLTNIGISGLLLTTPNVLAEEQEVNCHWCVNGSVSMSASTGSLPSNAFIGDLTVKKYNKDRTNQLVLNLGAISISEILAVNDDGSELGENVATEESNEMNESEAPLPNTNTRLSTRNLAGRQFASLQLNTGLNKSFGSRLFVGIENNRRRGLHKSKHAAVGGQYLGFKNAEADKLVPAFYIGYQQLDLANRDSVFTQYFVRGELKYAYKLTENSTFRFKVTRDWGEDYGFSEFIASLDIWFSNIVGISLKNRTIDYDNKFEGIAHVGNDSESLTGLYITFRSN